MSVDGGELVCKTNVLILLQSYETYSGDPLAA